ILERTSTEQDILAGPMPQRPLGRFGWNASILTLGGVKWDTRRTDSEAVTLVHRAMELGINTFDTAWAYGNGESERKLGPAMEVLGAGRAKLAASVEPYIRYTLGQDIDTAVIGVDNIAQLEENVRIAKTDRPAPTTAEIDSLLSEARSITQGWDDEEFDYVKG